MQNCGVTGGYSVDNDCARFASSTGSLLIKYERKRCAVFWFSLRKTALAKTSKDAKMRSIKHDW